MEWWQARTDNCPIGRTLELLGEKWTLLIVRDGLNGVRRFDDFRRHMGLSEAVLADAGQVIALRHRNCEGEVRVVVQCSHHKDQELSPHDMVTAMGPGARAVDPPLPPRR
jgi:DNA-binding HxlR family transcriptional regulator